jgi:hypothetical protein
MYDNSFSQQQQPQQGFYGAQGYQPQGIGMQPFVMFPAMTYEQQIIYRQQLAAQQRLYINKRLKEHFPVKYVLFHMATLTLIGIACIVLQIVLLVNNATNAFIANGIWAGFGCIGLALLAFALCNFMSILKRLFSIIDLKLKN